jgi:hypothetical protein
MTRIFLVVVTLTGLALVAAVASGLASLLGGGLTDPNATDVFLSHILLGLLASFAVLGTHCLVITYFLGTGRLIKEACLAYGFPDDGWPRQTRDIKRGNTPFAIVAMLVTIATAAAGQGRYMLDWPAWLHAAGAALTLLLNAWVWRREYRNLRKNLRLLDEMFAEVDRVRAEQGLPSNEEALRQQRG